MLGMENVEITIVGAGWNGLAVAKTWLEIHPHTNLVVLDDSLTIGGVWASHRLYPGLKSNNMRGNYEYSDFPLDEETFGVKEGEHIPGLVIHEYLKAYAKAFGVYRRIRFQSRVESAERDVNGAWVLSVSTGGEKSVLRTEKLVVAIGLTSEAFLPEFRGQAEFRGPILHCKDLRKYSDGLFETAKSVVVFGGTKSAWDAAYMYAKNEVQVEWVIRRSGNGPVWMSTPYAKQFKTLFERLIHTRWVTWFSPCVWGDADGFTWIRRFLHKTWAGRWIVDWWWKYTRDNIVKANGYDGHPETKKLKPWVDPFWIAGSLSILNYESDIFEFVRNGKIRVHIDDVEYLSPNSVHFSSGVAVHADALICSTGWKYRPSIQFLPQGIDRSLGLPQSEPNTEDSQVVQKADAEILKSFPRLRAQPRLNPYYEPLGGSKSLNTLIEPYRLFRFMVPPACINDRNIAFSGVVQSISTAFIAQTQGLWLTAYFDGILSLGKNPSAAKNSTRKGAIEGNVKWETILHSQFGRWRCPAGYGKRFPDFVYDGLPYIDLMLRDLGLRYRRKSGLLREIFENYTTADYRGLVDEWKEKQRETKGSMS